MAVLDLDAIFGIVGPVDIGRGEPSPLAQVWSDSGRDLDAGICNDVPAPCVVACMGQVSNLAEVAECSHVGQPTDPDHLHPETIHKAGACRSDDCVQVDAAFVHVDAMRHLGADLAQILDGVAGLFHKEWHFRAFPGIPG